MKRRKPPVSLALSLARGYECPDCNNDVRVTELAPGIVRAAVLHDDTCPWLARQEAEGRS